MTTPQVAGHFKGKPRGNGWQARCPAHEDHNASLSVSEGLGGRTLLKCHAGCTFDQIVSAAGLSKSDLMPPIPEKTKKRIVKTYDYVSETWELAFQVCRYEPKDFRQRRKDPDKAGAWTWNLKGVKRVLYRLPAVLKAKEAGETIFVVEGEKDVEALESLGLVATCNSGGAGKWDPHYTETLAGADIVILPDKDLAGRKHAALVQKELAGKATSVRVVELPDRDGKHVKDAADWIGHGGTASELAGLVERAGEWTPPEEEPSPMPDEAPASGKPLVRLPQGLQSISMTGRQLGELLSATKEYFMHGGSLARLVKGLDRDFHLEPVKPAALASDFERVAALVKRKGKDEDDISKYEGAICPEQTAKLISESAAFKEQIPPVCVLSRCPVLTERDGELVAVTGYDRGSGILVTGGGAVATMSVTEGRSLLVGLLEGYRFSTRADLARALAATITPALILGGLLKGRAPVDLGEADNSQTGKGFRNKLTAAIYRHHVKPVTQQKGGVGSMEESFNTLLIRGVAFISLDNIRGKIDSPGIESFLTEDTYQARIPFSGSVEIDPRRTIVMMTSNKADVTTDFANRCSCVRMMKQPDGYEFRSFPEGDVLDHIRENQNRYLGAVFSVIRAWHEAGKPRTKETRHSFRAWAQTLDWITQNLLEAGPLLDGHSETQARMTNPVQNWLRDVALEVSRSKQSGVWLRANELVDLLSETGMEMPGLSEGGDLGDSATRMAVLQATGRKMGRCFKAGDVVTIDGMTIERRETLGGEHYKSVKEYRFTFPPMTQTDVPEKANCPGCWHWLPQDGKHGCKERLPLCVDGRCEMYSSVAKNELRTRPKEANA